ncbi:MAG: hypothetical protein ABJA84_03530 [Polaromonas sp.]
MSQEITTIVQHKKASFKMKRLQVLPLVLGLFFTFSAAMVNAQTAGATAGATPMTREQVKMERDEFLRTHRWDTETDNWVMKPGIEAPAGMKSRAEVKAEREEFMRNHRWDQVSDNWLPMDKAPRDLSKLSREQVRAEAAQFVRTHRWDDDKSAWVEITPRPPRARK